MSTARTAAGDAWPSLRVEDWGPTRDTLHMWTQIVGKVRTYEAAAERGGWDRAALEDDPARWDKHRW